MELPLLPLDTYLAISLVIATPWLYYTFSAPSKPSAVQALSALLLVHTLCILHALFVSPSQNLFKSLGLHLTDSPDSLRAGVAELYGGVQNIPQHLDTLLKRLGLMDLRVLYIRFGHYVLTTCSHCQSYDDFALYALPGPLLEYIREIAFVGLLTLPKSSTAHFRPLGLGALLAALLAEIYWTLTVQVIVPPRESDVPVIYWHDNFLQMRHFLFLLLPILLTILPSMRLHRIPILGALIPAPEGSLSKSNAGLPPAKYQLQGQNSKLPVDATLSQASSMTMETLAHIVPTLHLLKYAHAAVMRSQSPLDPNLSSDDDNQQQGVKDPKLSSSPSPSMHTLASRWWATEALEGQTVRTDPGVTTVLKSIGLGLDAELKDPTTGEIVQPEGQLKASATKAVDFLKEQGAKPSAHWVR